MFSIYRLHILCIIVLEVKELTIIETLRREKGISMKNAADDLGLRYTTYVKYEKGERQPDSEILIMLADYFGVSVDTLIGRKRDFFQQKIPILGRIACGMPILAEENLNGYVDLLKKVKADFALECKGDSMITARIFDGDIVFIRQQPDVDDGDIAAVLIGDETTLKKVKHYPNRLVLCPCNPMYQELVYRDEELNDVRILGKAVWFLSEVRK